MKDKKRSRFFGIPLILPYMKPYVKKIILMIILGILSSLIDSVFPLFHRHVLDKNVMGRTLDG
nr:hypothetical protein [Lachnospiraceae bacterium]